MTCLPSMRAPQSCQLQVERDASSDIPQAESITDERGSVTAQIVAELLRQEHHSDTEVDSLIEQKTDWGRSILTYFYFVWYCVLLCCICCVLLCSVCWSLWYCVIFVVLCFTVCVLTYYVSFCCFGLCVVFYWVFFFFFNISNVCLCQVFITRLII